MCHTLLRREGSGCCLKYSSTDRHPSFRPLWLWAALCETPSSLPHCCLSPGVGWHLGSTLLPLLTTAQVHSSLLSPVSRCEPGIQGPSTCNCFMPPGLMPSFLGPDHDKISAWFFIQDWRRWRKHSILTINKLHSCLFLGGSAPEGGSDVLGRVLPSWESSARISPWDARGVRAPSIHYRPLSGGSSPVSSEHSGVWMSAGAQNYWACTEETYFLFLPPVIGITN